MTHHRVTGAASSTGVAAGGGGADRGRCCGAAGQPAPAAVSYLLGRGRATRRPRRRRRPGRAARNAPPDRFADLLGDPLVGAWAASPRGAAAATRSEAAAVGRRSRSPHRSPRPPSRRVRRRRRRLTWPAATAGVPLPALGGALVARPSGHRARTAGVAASTVGRGDRGHAGSRARTRRSGWAGRSAGTRHADAHRAGRSRSRTATATTFRPRTGLPGARRRGGRSSSPRRGRCSSGTRRTGPPSCAPGCGRSCRWSTWARVGAQRHRPDAFGAFGLTRPASAADFAVTLVHEFQHSKLSALLDLVPLYDRGATRAVLRAVADRPPTARRPAARRVRLPRRRATPGARCCARRLTRAAGGAAVRRPCAMQVRHALGTLDRLRPVHRARHGVRRRPAAGRARPSVLGRGACRRAGRSRAAWHALDDAPAGDWPAAGRTPPAVSRRRLDVALGAACRAASSVSGCSGPSTRPSFTMRLVEQRLPGGLRRRWPAGRTPR